MAKLLGVGGVFIKYDDPEAVRAWYRRVLGLESESWGAIFTAMPEGQTVWAPFARTSKKFDPSAREVMVNFVVDDLDAVLAKANAEGVETLGREAHEGYGKFAWLMDPGGVKIELWQAS